MSIFTPNNIQTGVTTTYTDEYLKEALANLGQRKGAKGDGLSNGKIQVSDFDKTITDYLQLTYTSENNIIKFLNGNNVIKTIDVSNNVLNSNFTISEKIDNNVEYFSDVNIYKTNSGYFSVFNGRQLDENSKISEVNVIEITNNNTIVGTAFIKENIINFCFSSNKDKTIKNYIINSENPSLDSLYNLIANCKSISEVNEVLQINEDDSIIVNASEDYHYSNLEAYINIFPYYIKNIYVQNKYFLNETDFILGLKYRILADICIKLYNYAIENSIESVIISLKQSYSIKIPVKFVIDYVYNDTTQIPYLSYTTHVLFTNLDHFNVIPELNFIAADFETSDNASNRLVAIQFTIIDDSEFIDTINVNILFEYPYIDKSDDSSFDTWFINGENTEIRAVGKDAGTPNILLVSFTDNSSSKDEKASYDSYPITVNVEHTYFDDTIDYDEVLSLFYNDTVDCDFYYSLDPSDIIGTSDRNLYKFTIKLPSPEKILSDNRYERLFVNSLMIVCVDLKISDTIISSHTLQQKIHGSSDKTSYITLYYHLLEENNTLEWKPIYNPAFTNIDNAELQPVFDFTTLAGVRDIVPYIVIDSLEPDKYFHQFLVFDGVGSAYKQSDQQLYGSSSKYYPILKTDPAEYYKIGEIDYLNNLQFVPKFVRENIVTINEEGRISNVSDSPTISSEKIDLFNIDSESKIDGVFNDNGDYIPSSNTDAYPIFDFREVLGNNLSILNRVSILGLDKNGKVLHAFLGNDIDLNNKNILKLSSNKNSANLRHNKSITQDYSNISEFDKFIVEMPIQFDNVISGIFRILISDDKLFIKCFINIIKNDSNIVDTENNYNSIYLPNLIRHDIQYNIQNILNTYFGINNKYLVKLSNNENLPKEEFNGIKEILIELQKTGSSYDVISAYENTTNMFMF